MEKRRKYNGKNKKSFIIILIVSIVIIAIFSLFIYKYSKISKIEYIVEAGSVIQDTEKNYLTVDKEAVLKIKWGGRYYLIYNDENIDLGRKVIVYNTVTGKMNLYGTFYEIAKDGKIIEYKDESVLQNTTQAKFYKLDDREYLLVGTKIFSEDNAIQTDNYLLVELDKAGNAKLSNNKINLKTISPTKLVTSEYTFDIANEILNFGEFDIDLKKIIGSTNQYVPEGEGTGDGTGSGSGTGTGDGTGGGSGSGSGTGNGFGTGVGEDNVVNNNDTGDINDMEDLKDKGKMTSVIRIVEGLNQIDVDYVVYDPYNEYKTVYIEVMSVGKIDIIYLDKKETHVTLSDLKPDTDYQLNFVYTVSNDSNSFGSFELKTKKPVYDISVEKVSTYLKNLEYKINLQDNFSISKISVDMSFKATRKGSYSDKLENITLSNTININEDDIRLGYKRATFSLSEYNMTADTLVELTIKSVESPFGTIEIGSTNSFRFGRNL